MHDNYVILTTPLSPGDRIKFYYITATFHTVGECYCLSGKWFVPVRYIAMGRYLGHILNDNMNDDDDIRREIKNLFVRTNVLISRFHRWRSLQSSPVPL